MLIAFHYENGQIFQHFGHTQKFKLYEAADQKIVTTSIVSTNGSGHGALAGLLKNLGAEVLICGGIGGGAKSALAQNGILIYGGVAGDTDQAVKDYLAGTLIFQPDIQCSHHHEGEEHHCGDHGCGNHSCEHH